MSEKRTLLTATRPTRGVGLG